MPSTTNIALSVPAHGANVDTWDADPVNNNSQILDNAFGGITSLSLSATSTTLNTTASQAAILQFSGILTANVTVTLAAIIKSWTVLNLCTGTGTLTLSTGTGQVLGLPPGNPVDVFSNGTNLRFKNLGNISQYEDWSVSSIPAWVSACTIPPYLLADGSTYSSTVYPALFLLTGTTALADGRGRSRAALDGGTGRITTGGSGIDGTAKLSAGGSQTAALDATQMPAHTHSASVTDPGHNHTINGLPARGGTLSSGATAGGVTMATNEGALQAASTGISVSNSTSGGGLAHINMPPTYIGGITVVRAA